MTRQHVILALVAAFAAMSPYLGIPGWTPSLATVAAFVAISLMGLNLIFGFCGMLALGQAAFAAIPAYVCGILVARGMPLAFGIVIGLVVTVLVARLIGSIFIRLPGIYLAVGTLGFAYVVEGIARAFPSVTGGASGLVLTLPFTQTETQWYIAALTAVSASLAVTIVFLRGATARRLKLVQRDELSAAVAGIDVVRLKGNVFTIGAAYSAVGGLLLTYYTSVVTPEMGGANTSLEYLAMAVIGGAGSIAGPIVGAIAINWLFSVAGGAGHYELLVYGLCFLAAILFAPGGLVGLARRIPLGRRSDVHAATDVALPTPALSAGTGSGLRASGVSKRFGGLHAVRDVNLDVARGEIVAVLGPNGAGKSTFFNILSGIENSDEGTVVLDDKSIDGLSIHARAAMIGRSFQVPRLVLDMTVLQNVIVRVDQLYPALTERERVATALSEIRRFNLDKFASARVGEVAVGHHKLIDIARAAVGSPPLVLLDEPAVGLTGEELEALKGIIRTLTAAGSAVVLVDHNIAFVMSLADRILVMEGGKPIAFGSPQDVINDPGVRAAYLGVAA